MQEHKRVWFVHFNTSSELLFENFDFSSLVQCFDILIKFLFSTIQPIYLQ